jgi:hypothetical protein
MTANLEECKIMNHKKRSAFSSLLLVCFGAAVLVPFPAKEASACGGCTPCSVWSDQVTTEMDRHKDWMVDEWWEGYVEPGLMKLSDQTIKAMSWESSTIGRFMDAQNQLGSMQALQEMNAKSTNSYATSTSLCQFGSLTKSLAASEAKAKANQIVLAERSQNRQLGHNNMASQTGSQGDRMARLAQFQAKFCDKSDFNGGMKDLCSGAPPDTMLNLDIDFARAVDAKKTLNVDFTNAAKTNDEEAVIALASNLYAHETFDRMGAGGLKDSNAKDNRTTYLDQRSIVAKRSVAENSFNAWVGKKAEGEAGSKTYIEAVLKSLGVPAADLPKYLGDKPSYDAQMEVLTKKVFQDPAYYANLMDNPANVQRQYASLQAFGLMQQRDIFETILRSEMLLSLIVEMEVSKFQDDVQNRLNSGKK